MSHYMVHECAFSPLISFAYVNQIQYPTWKSRHHCRQRPELDQTGVWQQDVKEQVALVHGFICGGW